MEISGISNDRPASSWNVYEDYRRSLQQNAGGAQNAAAAGKAAASGTQQAQQPNAVQKAADSQGCQTCRERKYQDESNDPGVSFKSAARVAPSQAASMVRGHELEHVSREQDKASQEGREVVSQSVTYHNGICPECGHVYIAGGTTQTVTRSSSPSTAQASSGENFDAYA